MLGTSFVTLRLLVTGGLGFIGSNFVKYHLTEHPEDTIVNLDKETYAASALASKELRSFRNNKLVKGDICNRKVVEKWMKGVDAVVHLAAETHVDRSIKNPRPFVRTNVAGTLNLLIAARRYGVSRFHHVSTDEVYGSLPLDTDEKFNEGTRYNPRNPYSASKAASDFLVRAFHETYGLHTTITNCSNNFGPFQHLEKLIPKTILNALSNRPIPVYGDGKNVRDWLFVTDHCSAIDLVMRRGAAGETYCVSAGNEFSNLQITRMLLMIVGKDDKLIQFVEDRPGHDMRYSLDSTKIRSQLGWRSRHPFRESLSETVQWYTERKNVL
jgi:dTDP-glucose 4,6-dehydratase